MNETRAKISATTETLGRLVKIVVFIFSFFLFVVNCLFLLTL